jgi:hypothetical protein
MKIRRVGTRGATKLAVLLSAQLVAFPLGGAAASMSNVDIHGANHRGMESTGAFRTLSYPPSNIRECGNMTRQPLAGVGKTVEVDCRDAVYQFSI